jgi:glycosyltransferase involved in cell wall biosynthesis
MSDRPTVSVITIFLDAERFLPEAVESVLRQDFHDWELLLVDDGSSDASTGLARSFAQGDPRIRYLQHPGHENRGMGTSRNLGLAHARGGYLVCLDSDDWLFPGALSRHVEMFDAHPSAAMVYGSADWWSTWDPGRGGDWNDGAGAKVEPPNSLVEPPALLTLFLRDGGAVPCWCSTAFRATPVRAVGGFDEGPRDPLRDLYEDQVLFAKLLLEHPAYVTEATLGRYRQHDEQACVVAERSGTEPLARARFLRWLSAYADERRIRDSALRAALSDEIGNLQEVAL